MKRILITNDDGFKSPGIEALVRAFKGLGEVILVAPQDEKSCSSHSITSPSTASERSGSGRSEGVCSGGNSGRHGNSGSPSF